PVLFAVAGYFRISARDAYRVVRTRLARLNAFLQESLQGMVVTQAFAREAQEFGKFQELNDDHRRALFRSTVYDASLYASVEAIGSAAVALLLWYGGGQIWRGMLTFGGLVAFLQYTNRFFLPIRDLGAKYTVMQAAMASAERIFRLLEVAPAIVSPPVPTLRPAGREATGVAFRGVWFAYEREHWVLRDCSFEVAPGEHVAIVGATGEGKSTCARLLNRSYDVRQGRVLVDGIDVREWDLASLRRHVGIIFQDSVLFAGSIEDNLRLGADGAVSPAQLTRAIETSRAGFVTELPRGL